MSTQRSLTVEALSPLTGFIESGYQPPQHDMRQVIDRPFQPQQTGPRRDSDQLQKLGAPTAPDDLSQLVPFRVLRASKNSQHPIGVARRGSNELNQRGDQKMPAYGQHPQPQRSRSMPTLLDSTRASFVDTHSHMQHSSAGSTGTPGSSAVMHRSSPWLAPAGSVPERGRPTPLAPAVAAAAAALQTPLSARRTSQGSFTSGMMRPQVLSLTLFSKVLAFSPGSGLHINSGCLNISMQISIVCLLDFPLEAPPKCVQKTYVKPKSHRPLSMAIECGRSRIYPPRLPPVRMLRKGAYRDKEIRSRSASIAIENTPCDCGVMNKRHLMQTRSYKRRTRP